MNLLSRDLLQSDFSFPADVAVSPVSDLPVKVLQFGEGNFLRCFIDWMIHHMNKQGLFNGKVAVVQPIEAGFVCEKLTEQNGIYTTILRGIANGEVVEEKEINQAVASCTNPYSDPEGFLKLANNPDLRFIFSNTTEAGIVYRAEDQLEDMPQVSYPGKLTRFLYERYKAFAGDPEKGFIIIPCELIEHNGDTLREIVFHLAADWGLEEGFINWLKEANTFLSTLVDRIVTGYPRNEIDSILASLGYTDQVLDTAEPFHFFVIEGKDCSDELPLAQAGLNVVWTKDMSPYRTRKVRILNGAHTMTVLGAYLSGLDTVKEFMDDDIIHQYMDKGLFDEIIPTLDLPKEELVSYSASVSERFANPFIRHLLLDISLNSTSKYKTRCLPSLLTYIERKNELPSVLVCGLAALIVFYRGKDVSGRSMNGLRCVNGTENAYRIQDDEEALSFFAAEWAAYEQNPDVCTLASHVLAHTAFWGQDLSKIEGLTAKTAGYIRMILTDGAKAAMKSVL